MVIPSLRKHKYHTDVIICGGVCEPNNRDVVPCALLTKFTSNTSFN